RPITKAMVDQAIEAIRKRVDRFGVSEPIITPQGNDRILVQIPGLDAANIEEAREQLSRVAKLEFRLVYPDNGERLRAIDEGKKVITHENRIEVYKMTTEGNEKPREERLLVKKKADLGGDRVKESHAYYGNEGWTVQLKFDGEGAKQFGKITEQYKGHRFAIVLDGVIQSATVIRVAIYGGDALTMFRFVLTLPGIAGIILTIGLSVDANVLIYERLREEMALRKSLRVAMETAYQKAFSSIFDANVTTLITALILFWQAAGPV